MFECREKLQLFKILSPPSGPSNNYSLITFTLHHLRYFLDQGMSLPLGARGLRFKSWTSPQCLHYLLSAVWIM